MKSKLEEKFAFQIKAMGIPSPTREYRFHPVRRFRFDFAWPSLKVAVEIDGGTWTGGRHTRGKGYESDCVKFNIASCEGWSVLRGTTGMVRSGDLVASLEELIRNKQEQA